MTIDEKRIDSKVLDAVAIAISGAPYTTKQSLRKAASAILAYESAKQREAEGWVLVPKEPTQAMMAAPKMREWACRTEDDVTAEDVADCYRQMLAAAPKPSSALLSAGGEG